MSTEEVLWAPWRMQYLRGPKPEGCPFCRIGGSDASRFREELVLVRRAHAFVCMNLFPFQSGHLLVVPRRHTHDLEALTPGEYTELFTLLREATAAVRRALSPAGVNLGFNLGAAAGAGIADHLHGHVVPRWVGDTNFLPVLTGTHTIPEYLDETWQKLRAAFEPVEGEKSP